MLKTSPLSHKNSSNAFTLVEMLVVMVLLALIIGILFQGLGLVGKVHNRLIPRVQQLQLNSLQEQWFRGSVSGLIAAVNIEELFIGTSTGFKGLSVSPLNSPYNAPAIIKWSINESDDKKSLNYQQQQFSWKIKTYNNNSDLEFFYLDNNGQWSNSWVAKFTSDKQPLLPDAIALKSFIGDNEHWWVAVINGEKNASWWVLDNE